MTPVAASKSSKASTGCGCLFFAVFFCAGLFFFCLMIGTVYLPEWRANHLYVTHSCTVLDKRLGESNSDGTTYRVDIRIRYNVLGQEYDTWTYDAARGYSSGRSGKEEILKQFSVGQQYPCWYDPNDPAKVVLVRGYSWLLSCFLLIPLIFMAVGGGGMYAMIRDHGKSPEQLAARKRSDRIAAGVTDGGSDFPTVPAWQAPAGERLRYRLKLSLAPSLKLLGAIAICAFWNGIVSVFVYAAWTEKFQGMGICLGLFLIPFVLVGLCLIWYVIKQFLVTIGIPPAEVEIDAHPLAPGQAAELLIRQGGRCRLNRIDVFLLCEESAKYTVGTDTRTETKVVHRSLVKRSEHVEVRSGEPWEFTGKLSIPAGAMHTFEAKNNSIQWKLLIKGDVAGWPDFEWDYPLLVRPAGMKGGLV